MTREEEDILDEIIPDESIPINAAIKYTVGDSDIAGENGVDAVTMITASSDACAYYKPTVKDRLKTTFHLVKLVFFYLLRPSLVISLSYFGLMLIPIVTLYFLSHSKNELLAGCYTLSFINITGVSVMFAIISGCNHRLVQHNLRRSNTTLQKTCIIWFLYCLVLCAVWLNSGLIFRHLDSHEYHLVAEQIEKFCYLFTPGLFFLGVSLLLQTYMLLVKEDTTYPVVLSNFLTFGVNVLLNYTLPREGVRSGAVAADLSFACLCVFLFLWVIWDDDYRCSWTGLSWSCLCNWWDVLKPILICLFLVVAEWWVFDVATILIGPYRTQYVVTHTVTVLIIQPIFMLFHIFATASSLQTLDAMNESYCRRGVFIIKATLFILWVSALLIGAVLAFIYPALIECFIKNDPSWSIDPALRIVGILPYIKCAQTLGFHVQRRFYQTSFIFLMTCQLILGFPLGLCLLFYSDNGVYGVWVGYIIGMFVQMIYFLAGLYSYVQEFSITRNYPKWKESSYSRDDIDDLDGKKTGVASLLLRYPHMRMRFTSIDILCSHSIDSGLENQSYAFGDSLKDVEIKTIFWRTVNFLTVLAIFVAGFCVRYK